MTDERPDRHRDRLREMLQKALPAMDGTELSRDLWPEMRQRIAESPRQQQWLIQVDWFDWALAGAVTAALLLFPAAIPALLYHL